MYIYCFLVSTTPSPAPYKHYSPMPIHNGYLNAQAINMMFAKMRCNKFLILFLCLIKTCIKTLINIKEKYILLRNINRKYV